MRLPLFAVLLTLAAPAAAAPRYAIIDMHLHAEPADAYGPPGQVVCTPYESWPTRDPGQPIEAYLDAFSGKPACAKSVRGEPTDDAVRDATLAQLKRLNMLGVVSGPLDRVADWTARGEGRVIPAIGDDWPLPPVADLRAAAKAGRIKVIGEITAQYDGLAPDDPKLEPYYALAEELDLPLSIHIGPGPPGVAYFGNPKMRLALARPTALESVLLRHPKLRLYVAHAGWPYADDMIALLYAHPQVYVDTGIIDYAFPRAGFHAYLKRLFDAGFGKRIMFGSDQMIWPGAIPAAVEGITSAPFLSAQQKRDILHDNAARFLRIEG